MKFYLITYIEDNKPAVNTVTTTTPGEWLYYHRRDNRTILFAIEITEEEYNRLNRVLVH